MIRKREKERQITFQILRNIQKYLRTQYFDIFELFIKNIIESNYVFK